MHFLPNEDMRRNVRVEKWKKGQHNACAHAYTMMSLPVEYFHILLLWIVFFCCTHPSGFIKGELVRSPLGCDEYCRKNPQCTKYSFSFFSNNCFLFGDDTPDNAIVKCDRLYSSGRIKQNNDNNNDNSHKTEHQNKHTPDTNIASCDCYGPLLQPPVIQWFQQCASQICNIIQYVRPYTCYYCTHKVASLGYYLTTWAKDCLKYICDLRFRPQGQPYGFTQLRKLTELQLPPMVTSNFSFVDWGGKCTSCNEVIASPTMHKYAQDMINIICQKYLEKTCCEKALANALGVQTITEIFLSLCNSL